MHFTRLLTFTSLLGGSALHDESTPLRGYTCSQHNVHQPCELCPEGYYCKSKDLMLPCGGNNVYCPLGASQPTPVTQGYHTIGLEEDKKYSEEQCEAGFFCTEGVKKVCPQGFYCPISGMSSPLECGNSTVYCEEGSAKPTPVLNGYYSIGGTNTTRTAQVIAPLGYYASNGLVLPCHEGHYGSEIGLSVDSCSGTCEKGWYCPPASVSSRQFACGGENQYCPPGSAKPKNVQLGYYTSKDEDACKPGTYRTAYASGDVDVSSIRTSRIDGVCIPCPKDTYKYLSGDDISLCLDCATMATSTPDRMTCECFQSATDRTQFKLQYNVVESKCYKLPSPDDKLSPDDFYTPNSQLTKSEEMPCEKGHFCQRGMRYKCPGGRYGDKDLETLSDCTDACMEGHWCGEASISPTENKCGSPNVYCPRGSLTPVYVSVGYYTDEEEPYDSKTAQYICPKGYWCENGLRHPCDAGLFGDTLGLNDASCSGTCLSGYYCPSGSTSPHQLPCGNSTVFCPDGSSIPTQVDEGYYSSLENGAVIADYYAGPNATQQIQVQCEVGHYCKDGVKYSCPEGTYGTKLGATDVSDCEPCTEGYYCESYPGPPTIMDSQVPCGEVYLYCPQGSPKPIHVEMGYYTIDVNLQKEMDASHVRTDQVQCEPGFHCQNGIRYACRAGTYGETPGLVSENCSGVCPRGFFCPENSVKPIPCSPGAYSTGGASDCTNCEIRPEVSMEVINSLCRDDRSCCIDFLDAEWMKHNILVGEQGE